VRIKEMWLTCLKTSDPVRQKILRHVYHEKIKKMDFFETL
jgi:hypothetical protein